MDSNYGHSKKGSIASSPDISGQLLMPPPPPPPPSQFQRQQKQQQQLYYSNYNYRLVAPPPPPTQQLPLQWMGHSCNTQPHPHPFQNRGVNINPYTLAPHGIGLNELPNPRGPQIHNGVVKDEFRLKTTFSILGPPSTCSPPVYPGNSTSSSTISSSSTSLPAAPPPPVYSIRKPYSQGQADRTTTIPVSNEAQSSNDKNESHECGAKCVSVHGGEPQSIKLWRDLLKLKSPLELPQHFNWQRTIDVMLTRGVCSKRVIYITPCGKRLMCKEDIYSFICQTNFLLSVDYFCFDVSVNCSKKFHPRYNFVTVSEDISNGLEMIPIECINEFDQEIPQMNSYTKKRIIGESAFEAVIEKQSSRTCCDCKDDCQVKSKCACWKRTAKEAGRRVSVRFGYEFKKLNRSMLSGIYECNDKCSCRINHCFNRVVQFPIIWTLELFKSNVYGWGVRSLYEIPKGTFLCRFVGRVGAAEDDYEKALDGHQSIGMKRRRSYRITLATEKNNAEDKPRAADDASCIPGTRSMKCRKFGNSVPTNLIAPKCMPILSPEMIKSEPGSVTSAERESSSLPLLLASNSNGAQKNPEESEEAQNNKEFIIDAFDQGNIAKYINHSCDPNLFLQKVYVFNQDPRLPYLAFFTKKHIKSGTELTVDYNLDQGRYTESFSPCHCHSKKCKDSCNCNSSAWRANKSTKI